MKKVSLVLVIALGAFFLLGHRQTAAEAKKSQLESTWELVNSQHSPKVREISDISEGTSFLPLTIWERGAAWYRRRNICMTGAPTPNTSTRR